MFYKWGKLNYRFRWIVPIVMIALVAGLFLGEGLKLGGRLSQEGWDDPHASSTTAKQIEQDEFGRDNSGDVILLFTAPQGVDDEAFANAANKHLTDLANKYPDQIARQVSYFNTKDPRFVNEDHKKAFAAIGIKGDGEQTLKDYRVFRDDLTKVDLPGEASVQLAGATAVVDTINDGMTRDLAASEKWGLIPIAILLLFVFGSVVAALMPLVIGVLAILGAHGILSIMATGLQVNAFAQAVITLLGLGLAIDYGLFMVSRFREELDAGASVPDAVATTTATAGKTVVFSAFMVMVALSGMVIFPQAFLKSVAYGGVSAVALAALFSVTILPAVFGMLGKNVDKLSLRKTSRRARRVEDSFWYKAPSWAMRHSTGTTVVLAGALILMSLPLSRLEFGGINEGFLPPDNSTRVAQEEFSETFPTMRTSPVKLVVQNANEQQVNDILAKTKDVPGLSAPMAITQHNDTTTVLSAGIADKEAKSDIVKELRDIPAPDGVKTYVGGDPAQDVESIEALTKKMPWLVVYLVATTFILMSLIFGSLIQPAKAVIMTALGMGATLGLLTWMFVEGYGASIFNYSANPLMSAIVVLIVSILYGLSTDYEVFLLSRMIEARERGAETDEAIRVGTARTGTIITAAALIMIVVTGAFGFSSIVMMKYLAFGMIFFLFIDATVIRMLLVPSVMHLLADDNWWAPRPIKAIYNKVGGHSFAEVPVAAAAEPGAVKAETPVTPAAAPAPVSAPASADPNETPIEESEVVPDVAMRGHRGTDRDSDLVPFAELMRLLEEDRRK